MSLCQIGQTAPVALKSSEHDLGRRFRTRCAIFQPAHATVSLCVFAGTTRAAQVDVVGERVDPHVDGCELVVAGVNYRLRGVLRRPGCFIACGYAAQGNCDAQKTESTPEEAPHPHPHPRGSLVR